MTTTWTMRDQGRLPGRVRRLVEGVREPAADARTSWHGASACPAFLGRSTTGAAYPTGTRVGNTPATENKSGGMGFAILRTARHLGARST